jgi:deoxyribodipyrimidine photo-lyase
MELMGDWGVKHLYGNIEYEVDELRRDIRVATLAKERNIHAEFIHDRPVVNPGLLKTKQGKDYAVFTRLNLHVAVAKPLQVYSPWQRSWLEFLNGKLALLDEASPPSANNSSIRQDERFGELFESKVPESVEGFECHDTKEMANLWPAGTDVAKDFLHRFLHSDAVSIKVSQGSGRNDGMTSSNKSRIGKYSDGRDRADIESTSKLSPYLASGIIPARHLIRETMAYNKSKHVQGGRDSGLGMWVQEVGECVRPVFPFESQQYVSMERLLHACPLCFPACVDGSPLSREVRKRQVGGQRGALEGLARRENWCSNCRCCYATTEYHGLVLRTNAVRLRG